ncbi:hypothetical protein GQ55_1G392000 [Panicum hallii var. hallii]|uniref:Uncharacterized protein n=1 Tax=Panicum hallii var. hallii TaxID=1504633 RepID=A0A2T7FC60_9POAL|nr:hypothetical protein GQ55_1G392000 [Panicum hallii var. hallii]
MPSGLCRLFSISSNPPISPRLFPRHPPCFVFLPNGSAKKACRLFVVMENSLCACYLLFGLV